MKWDFKIVVLLVEWSSFRGGLKAGFYCTLRKTTKRTQNGSRKQQNTLSKKRTETYNFGGDILDTYIYIRICNLKLQMCVNNRRRPHVEKRVAKRFSEADTPRTTV